MSLALHRSRLVYAPELADLRHKPPHPGVMADTMRAVESAKEVSSLDSQASGRPGTIGCSGRRAPTEQGSRRADWDAPLGLDAQLPSEQAGRIGTNMPAARTGGEG